MKMIIIREVLEKDNADLASVIRQVLVEIGVPKVGTAYADPWRSQCTNSIRSRKH